MNSCKNNQFPYIVYMHTSTITKKSYIGITKTSVEKRFKQHIAYYKCKGAKTHFHKAIKKYGTTTWKSCILYVSKNRGDVCEAEKQLIKDYDTYLNGYNNTTGGEYQYHRRPATKKERKQMSERMKINSIFVTNPLIGPRNHMYKIGKNHPLYGIKRSNSTKRKISENHTNRSAVNNTNAKIIYFQNPKGKIYKTYGTSKIFCKVHNLSFSTMRKLLDCGHQPKTGKCIGWKIWKE